MNCPNCGQLVSPQATFCPQCGKQLQVSAAQPLFAVPATRHHPRAATGWADLLQILADGLVIAAFFLPWIGVEYTSPWSLMLTGKIAWWMWLIPVLMAFGSLVDIFVTIVRATTGRSALSWRRWNYFTSGIFLAILCIGWWLLIVYLPVFPTPQGYVNLAYLLLLGTFVGVGIGLILVFLAAVLEIVAGILAYALPVRQ
jgi:hypothetical protein